MRTQLERWVGAVLVSLAATAFAGEQAEQAVAAVRAMKARGEVQAGAVLHLRVKQGNIAAFLGRNFELQSAWERQTGVLIDATVMPQLDSLNFIRSARDVDLTIARNHEYPDLVTARLIEDLTPFFQRFGFRLADDPGVGYIAAPHQAYFDGSIVAIPADGDITTLLLRRDLLEDATQRERFRAQFGRELAAPTTWSEYLDLVKFFHRSADQFYGALEPRERTTGWMYWMPRYAASSHPVRYLFDDTMRPLIHSPQGIAATENYIATVPVSPPEILVDGKDYSYTLPFFLRGAGFSTIITIAGAKISNLESSLVRDKFLVVPLPGQRVDGKLVRRPAMIYGNNLVIPRGAEHKELAFLFAMWLTDPDNSERSVEVAGGFADPYRYNHMRSAAIRKLYTANAIDVMAADFPLAVPSGTGLPGDAEYLAALSQNLWLAAKRELTASEAMARTAREWEAITNRLGRSQQIAHWKAFKRLFPSESPP